MIISGEELYEHRVYHGQRILIAKKLQARYHSRSSIDGPLGYQL